MGEITRDETARTLRRLAHEIEQGETEVVFFEVNAAELDITSDTPDDNGAREITLQTAATEQKSA